MSQRLIIVLVRTQIRELDSTIPVSFTTMEDIVSASLGTERLSMLLLLAFGLSAMSLAAVGIYGVISLSVSRRTAEMAIRAALGAEPNTVLWLSMKRGVTVAGETPVDPDASTTRQRP